MSMGNNRNSSPQRQINSAISDLIKPLFFVFSSLCLRVSVVRLLKKVIVSVSHNVATRRHHAASRGAAQRYAALRSDGVY